VKKYRGQGEWKDELTVRMDFPVCGSLPFCISHLGVMYTHTQILYT
jgi:hypothetical protein